MITFPTNTRSTISAIRSAIGRPVTFHKRVETVCPSGHGVDPNSNESLDPYCTICSGVGYVITYSGTVLSAHVTHDPASTHWTPGGKLPDGDLRLQIEYTDANVVVVDETEYVTADNSNYEIKKVTKRGVPEVNRLLLDLILRP